MWRVSEGEELRHDEADILRWLAEAQVELAAHRPGDVSDDAVQRDAARFVLVHARVEHVAQEAAALGPAERVCVVELPGGRVARSGVVVLQERDGVAHRRESQPDHAAQGGRVDKLVDAPRIEPGVHADVGRLLVLVAHERPGGAVYRR